MKQEQGALLAAGRLRFGYSVEGRYTPVLREISISVYPGELVCLVGPSGCGKSTLVRCLACLPCPEEGELVFRGRPVRAPGPERLMVFQDTHQLLPWLTCRGNVRFAAKHAGRSYAGGEIERYLSLVGMAEEAESFPYQLSGGMRQRVALARALAAGGELLLLDEPFGSLDAITREELQELLLRVREQAGHSYLFVTHDLREAAYLADRVLVMNDDGSQLTERRIELPHPRDREDRKLLSHVHGLREALAGKR